MTMELSGKDLATLLGVSAAAVSKAARHGHLCAGQRVSDWAQRSESGRVVGYLVPDGEAWDLLVKACKLPGNAAQIPANTSTGECSTVLPLGAPQHRPARPTLRLDRLPALPCNPTSQLGQQEQEEARLRAQRAQFEDAIVALGAHCLHLGINKARQFIATLRAKGPNQPPARQS